MKLADAIAFTSPLWSAPKARVGVRMRSGHPTPPPRRCATLPTRGGNRLERMLRPKSIAVIGGGAFGTNVVKQSLKMGFAGDIWPVHPTKDEVEGVKAYRTIADLPGSPDATFIGVNRNLTIEMVKALRERGAGGATCFAAGFLETGDYDDDGERLQRSWSRRPATCRSSGRTATG